MGKYGPGEAACPTYRGNPLKVSQKPLKSGLPDGRPGAARAHYFETIAQAPATERIPPITTRPVTASCFRKKSQEKKMIIRTESR